MDGIRAFGRTWWGKQWIDALQSFGEEWPNRLPRGKGYAEGGRVQDLTIKPGQVTARVAGSRARPYRVQLDLAVYTDAQWQALIRDLAGQMVYTVRLLRGEMPEGLPQLCEVHGLPLFPRAAGDLSAACSCPDWANPCKHVAAVHYVLGNALDNDPFLLFELRGRSRQALLAALAQARSRGEGDEAQQAPVSPGATEAEDVVLAGAPASDTGRMRRGPAPAVNWQGNPVAGVDIGNVAPAAFWAREMELPDLELQITEPAAELLALKRLGPPPSWSTPQTFEMTFRPIYEDAAELALLIVQDDAGLRRKAEGDATYVANEQPEANPPPRSEPTAPAPPPSPVPRLMAVCETLLSIAADAGYVRAGDVEQLVENERKLFRIALEALLAEGRLIKEGNGLATRYVPAG